MKPTTVAVLTGASKGLGHALALGLMRPDTHLVTISRSADEALSSRAAETGCALQQVQLDLADPAAAQPVLASIFDALPAHARRYRLINNAGSVAPIALASDLASPADIGAAFNLNVVSAMMLVALFLHATRGCAGSDRRILNISSGAGRRPTPGWGVYCATKAALDRYTEVLAAEQHGVRAVSLAPGVIDTGMQAVARSADPRDFPNRQRYVDLHRQGQLAAPAAVADQILRYIERDDFGAQPLADIRHHA